MTTWIEEYLKTEVPLDDIIEPFEEPQFQDPKSAGSMTNEQVRLYTLWQRLVEKSDRLRVDARHARKEEDRKALQIEFSREYRRATLMGHVFWGEIYESFNLWGKSSITVSKNREVFWTDTPLPPQLFNFGMG